MDPLAANIASSHYIVGTQPPDIPTPPSPPPSPSSTTPGGLYFLFAGLIIALILGATCLLLSCWKCWFVKRRVQAGSMIYNNTQASFQSRSPSSSARSFQYNDSSSRRPLSPSTSRPPLLRTHSTSPTQSDDKLNESDGAKGSVRQYQQYVVVVQPSGDAGAIGWYEEEEEAPQLERKESSEEEEGIDSNVP